MNTLRSTLMAAFCLCAAAAQTIPADSSPAADEIKPMLIAPQPVNRERPMLWGGLTSELILPGLNLGISAPLAQFGSTCLSARGTIDLLATIGDPAPGSSASYPAVTLNADLLLSSTNPGLKVYGGPSVATAYGAIWLLGGVAGVRNEFGKSNWGYAAEVKARAMLAEGTYYGFIPGLRLNLTYRF